MWRGRLFFLCLALALLSGCAPGGPVAEAGADAQLPADKLIAITFDDGPRRNTTERLLDGLQERGASATFFLIGKQIEGNEDLVRRMQAEGHQVGSHTWNHVRLQGVSRETLQREVGRTEETLEALLGGGPYWLRRHTGPWMRRTGAAAGAHDKVVHRSQGLEKAQYSPGEGGGPGKCGPQSDHPAP